MNVLCGTHMQRTDRLFCKWDQAHHDRVKIVPMCGYESIPFDLGTLMVVECMRERLNK